MVRKYTLTKNVTLELWLASCTQWCSTAQPAQPAKHETRFAALLNVNALHSIWMLFATYSVQQMS